MLMVTMMNQDIGELNRMMLDAWLLVIFSLFVLTTVHKLIFLCVNQKTSARHLNQLQYIYLLLYVVLLAPILGINDLCINMYQCSRHFLATLWYIFAIFAQTFFSPHLLIFLFCFVLIGFGQIKYIYIWEWIFRWACLNEWVSSV